jgi:pimeloyl-ACP methyl ester carboxylesterase
VAWDAPGAGSSPDPPERFTTTNYALRLAGFLDALRIGRAHVVGLSWGGILAQEFYRLYPERLLCLVLAGTYAGWKGSLPEPVWRERLETCLRDSTGPHDTLVAKLMPGMFTDDVTEDLRQEMSAIMSEFHPTGFRVMSRSSAAMDTRELLPTIDVPTLLLWGDDDRRSPMHIAEQLHAAIPSAELTIIADAGHVSNMEQPEMFNAHVRRFCLGLNVA